MTELNIRESAWAELHDPRTGQDRLAQIAGAHPEFASAIAAHPNAYPALQEWAAGVQPAQSPLAAAQLPIADPAVGAPAAEHRDNSRTWLVALVLFAAVELVRLVFLLIAFRIIQQSPGNGSAGDELLRWTGVLADAAQLVIVGVGALLSARSAGRRIGAALLAFLIPCFTVAVQLSMGSWTDVFLYGALLFSRIPELWILFYLALALSCAVARPVRGAGWAGVTLMALAYPLSWMAYFSDDWSLGQV
ncbi:MAG: hypothetical protein J0H64_03410, partial [Actinobacteria bacterium]|nr:hypothetical protein [Actinomycetota bacterium]